mgnify:CR=1 FL=1
MTKRKKKIMALFLAVTTASGVLFGGCGNKEGADGKVVIELVHYKPEYFVHNQLYIQIIWFVYVHYYQKKKGVSHEYIYLVKRSCRSCGKDRMHKSHLGKLAFQDDFCVFCLHCFAMETF